MGGQPSEARTEDERRDHGRHPAMDPKSAPRTVAGRRPEPRSRASRVPTTAVTGRPDAAAARAITDGPGRSPSAGLADRPPREYGEQAEQDDGHGGGATTQHQRIRLDSPGGIELPDRADRSQR
jgi:hypothetical protein